jgi:hypothetical protein
MLPFGLLQLPKICAKNSIGWLCGSQSLYSLFFGHPDGGSSQRRCLDTFLPISAKVWRSAALNCIRSLNWSRQMRFSATRYAFHSQRCSSQSLIHTSGNLAAFL